MNFKKNQTLIIVSVVVLCLLAVSVYYFSGKLPFKGKLVGLENIDKALEGLDEIPTTDTSWITEEGVADTAPIMELGKEPPALPGVGKEGLLTLTVESTDEKKVRLLKGAFTRGNQAIEESRFSDASEEFIQILRVDPDNKEASNYLFLCMSELRKRERQAKLDSETRERFQKGKVFFDEKNFDEAIDEFKKVLLLDATHTLASEYMKKAQDILSGKEAERREAERKLKEEEEKKREAERQKEIAKKRAEIPKIFPFAEKNIEDGNYEDAIKQLKDILSVDPYNKRALGMLETAQKMQTGLERAKIEVEAKAVDMERMKDVDKASLPVIDKAERAKKKESIKEEEFVPEIQKISALQKQAEQLVSLDFQDADLRDVIRFMVERTGINIVMDETILKEFSETGGLDVAQYNPFAPQTGASQAFGANQPEQMIPQQDMQALFPQQASQPQSPYQQGVPYQPSPYGQPQTQPGGMPPPGLVGLQPGSVQMAKAPQTSLKVTIYVNNVPLKDVLDIILRSKGLAYRIEENIIWISTPKNLGKEHLITKVYSLKHAVGKFSNFPAKPFEEGELGGREVSTGAEDLSIGSGQGLSPFSTSASTKSDMGFLGLTEGLKTEEETKREGSIKELITEIVPQPEGSRVIFYDRLNKLIVRNTPTNIKLVDQIIKSLDVATFQVSMEIRFIEISMFSGKNIGINWDYIKQINTTTTATTDITHESASFGKTESLTGGLGLTYATLGSLQLTAVLNALAKDKDAKTLSAPKLTCLNNQTANIRIVKNHKYISRWELSTAGYDEYLRERWEPVIGKISEGIVLEITPNVNDENNTITLTLHPSISKLVEMQTAGETAHPVTLPITTTKSADTTISIKNHYTLILGGLMENDRASNVRRVPWLSDIPLLGKLFQSKTTYKTKSNLLIFITAHMLDSEGREIE